MNKNLTKEFIIRTVGIKSVDWLATLNSVQYYVLKYGVTWIGFLGALLNFIVLVLSSIIYLKTKKKNQKPAFFYIGMLSLFDFLMES